MQKIKLSIFIAFFFIAIDIYCLVNVVTGGAYCQHFRINSSHSLPYYVFASSPITIIERDMFVSLSHIVSEKDLFKKVVGLPGDRIAIRDQHVFINDRDFGYVYQFSPSGTCLSPIEEGVIPENFFFVYATHPESFDSRYNEFGLVAKEQLKEKLCPIF